MRKSYKTGEYTNVFQKFGYDPAEIQSRMEQYFQEIFYGPERIYHDTPDGMGYLTDTGNNDVRTEGMSYGMMIAVQLDKKELFDRIWTWAKTYMWMETGDNHGYFAWSCGLDGSRNSNGPAPDGEEYFAMSLFFAAHRWGDGEGIYNYTKEAKAILHEMVHKGEDGRGQPMFNRDNKQILFVPGSPMTDPSYHLPHFFELYALWGNEADRDFLFAAADASRELLRKACHPETGMAAEYSYFDGRPWNENGRNHDHFYSDAYRVIANIGLDYEWFAADEWQTGITQKLQRFFCTTENPDYVFDIDGTPVTDPSRLVHEMDDVHKGVLHPVGLLATNAQASLASGDNEYSRACVKKLWDTPPRTGERRYYDNLLYLFAWMALSGNYRVW